MKNTTYPTISIVMPMKNTGVYLKPCIDSILAQTFTDWELIVVDDNSTDKSYDLVASYAKKDKRIILLKNELKALVNIIRVRYAYQTAL